MSTQLNEVLHALLDTFAPGLSWLVRLLSEILGVNALFYVLPVLVFPIISTIILPWILGSLEPIFSLIISSAEIQHRNNMYPQVKRWMSEVKFYSLSGSTIVGITEAFGHFWSSNPAPEFVETDDAAYRGKVIKVWITPGQSHFQFFRYGGHWFALYRDPHRNPLDTFSRNSENIFLYYPFWNQRHFEDLMETIQKFNVDSRRGKLPVFSAYQDKKDVGWRQMCDEEPRSQESMALKEDMKQDIITDIQKYLSRNWVKFYKERGIAQRRGYLFYGEPGTGKSSFCRVLATIFDLPIYTINLGVVDNHSLQELFRTLPGLPQRCLVVLEDIDTAGIQRSRNTASENESDGKEMVTLATILNVLDGLGAHSGHILIATTNAKPELDRALTRPGRIDKSYEFQYPDQQTIQGYFAFFFRNACSDKGPSNKELREKAVEFSKAVSHEFLSPATLQEYFLQCNGDPDAAIQKANNLVAPEHEILNIKTVDTHRQRNGFERVSGSAIIPGYGSDDPSTLYVLLVKRSPKSKDDAGELKQNSFPETYEGPGGGAMPEDKTIPKTIVRETHEETGLKLQIASDRVYCVQFAHKGYQMARYIAIATTCEKVLCQRRWSDKYQEPEGSDDMLIQLSDEHLDYVWATEEQIQSAAPYDPQATEQSGLVMIDSNRKIFLDFFSWVKKHGLRMEYSLPELDLQPTNRS